jgi:hypothetical protein
MGRVGSTETLVTFRFTYQIHTHRFEDLKARMTANLWLYDNTLSIRLSLGETGCPDLKKTNELKCVNYCDNDDDDDDGGGGGGGGESSGLITTEFLEQI